MAHITGDPEAFEAFYREHVAAIMRFVSRRVADPHLVADLTAEVFLAVIGSAHTYQPSRGSQVSWLYGIARNVIAGERRRAVKEWQPIVTQEWISVDGTRLGLEKTTGGPCQPVGEEQRWRVGCRAVLPARA